MISGSFRRDANKVSKMKLCLLLTMQREHSNLVGAGIVFIDRVRSKMLLVKGNLHQKWGPCKGHRNKYANGLEDPLACAIRETREEIGVDARGLFNDDTPVRIYSSYLFFMVDVDSTSEMFSSMVKEEREIMDVKWVTFDEVMNFERHEINVYLNSIRRGLDTICADLDKVK